MSGSQQGGEGSGSQGEDWRNIADQSERRKIQNRLAQRKYSERSSTTSKEMTLTRRNSGEKEKRKREDDARIAENQQAAGSAYAAPNARDLAPNANPVGLPWGSVSIKHVLEAGKAKEQKVQQASREGSAAPTSARHTTQG
ncbi:hypothetical protein MMC26_001311 [Xylographa opegraphella]|nr:hypothetical protein [Xylographa opegraphella]